MSIELCKFTLNLHFRMRKGVTIRSYRRGRRPRLPDKPSLETLYLHNSIEKVLALWYNAFTTRIEYFSPRKGKYLGKRCFPLFPCGDLVRVVTTEDKHFFSTSSGVCFFIFRRYIKKSRWKKNIHFGYKPELLWKCKGFYWYLLNRALCRGWSNTVMFQRERAQYPCQTICRGKRFESRIFTRIDEEAQTC